VSGSLDMGIDCALAGKAQTLKVQSVNVTGPAAMTTAPTAPPMKSYTHEKRVGEWSTWIGTGCVIGSS
jgi:hypothetical protein